MCSVAGAWRSSTTTPTLRDYIGRATDISPDIPVLVDRFLDDAIEIDVDALCDADGVVYLGGVMEHIEEAGIHSGDSACALPPITLGSPHLRRVREYTEAIARGVGVRGLLNVQYALKDDALYVLEANPRASARFPSSPRRPPCRWPRRRPGSRWAPRSPNCAPRACCWPRRRRRPARAAPIAVKEAVLPFKRFRTRAGLGVDTLLGRR
jgi:carbamoyl-phosphate synthase large subunit